MRKTFLGHQNAQSDARRINASRKIDRQSGVLKAKMMLGAALLTLASSVMPLRAQDFSYSQLIISDPLTGAALMGFDPVAYFIDHRARQGSSSEQANFAGKAWYFTSKANREAFEARPEVFVPMFGGYDPTAMAAGVLRAGQPGIFLRQGDKLYFFRDESARKAAQTTPDVLASAARLWPEFKRNLDP